MDGGVTRNILDVAAGAAVVIVVLRHSVDHTSGGSSGRVLVPRLVWLQQARQWRLIALIEEIPEGSIGRSCSQRMMHRSLRYNTNPNAPKGGENVTYA